MSDKDFVLWGIKYVEVPIKISGGNMRHCRARQREREREGGWEGLRILPEGAPYNQTATAS